MMMALFNDMFKWSWDFDSFQISFGYTIDSERASRFGGMVLGDSPDLRILDDLEEDILSSLTSDRFWLPRPGATTGRPLISGALDFLEPCVFWDGCRCSSDGKSGTLSLCDCLDDVWGGGFPVDFPDSVLSFFFTCGAAAKDLDLKTAVLVGGEGEAEVAVEEPSWLSSSHSAHSWISPAPPIMKPMVPNSWMVAHMRNHVCHCSLVFLRKTESNHELCDFCR